jgi:hypothetical protein
MKPRLPIKRMAGRPRKPTHEGKIALVLLVLAALLMLVAWFITR